MGFYFGILGLIVVLSFAVFFANERAKKAFNVHIDKLHIYHFFVCFIVTSYFFYLFNKRNEYYKLDDTIMQFLLGFNLVFAVCFALYVFAKKTAPVKPTSNELKQVPDICPNCKNSNTQKSSTCEWCGKQMI